jgi:hypothetical protein
MGELKETLKKEVRKYASNGRGLNLMLFPLLDDESQVYAVSAVNYPKREPDDVAGIVVLARIAGGKIVIEEDMTDKKLIDALLQQGVPREKIVLAYDGEPIPDPDYELPIPDLPPMD